MVEQTIRGLVLTAPGSITSQVFARPKIANDEALLRPELVGICGTDRHTYGGLMPFPLPLLLGHEIVGSLEEVGPEFRAKHGVNVGDRVSVGATVPCGECGACMSQASRLCEFKTGYGSWTSSDMEPHLWGGMAELMFLAANSVLQRIESNVSSAAALIGHTIFVNGIQWLKFVGNLREFESVLIQGCGPQGVAAALAAKACGAAQVIVAGLQRDAERLEHVEALGCLPVRADEVDLPLFVNKATKGSKVDVVLNVTGDPASVNESVASAKRRGRVLLAGLGGPKAKLSVPMDIIVNSEIALLGCFGKSESAHQQVNRLLHSDNSLRTDLESLISHFVRLEDVPAILSGKLSLLDLPSTLKIVVSMSEES